MIDSPTLEQAIREFGFYSIKGKDDQRREVRDCRTHALVGEFTAKEAWEWYHEGIRRYLCDSDVNPGLGSNSF